MVNDVGDKYQKQVLEKWIRQIKSGEIKPEALDLGTDAEKAVERLRSQLNKMGSSSYKSK